MNSLNAQKIHKKDNNDLNTLIKSNPAKSSKDIVKYSDMVKKQHPQVIDDDLRRNYQEVDFKEKKPTLNEEEKSFGEIKEKIPPKPQDMSK